MTSFNEWFAKKNLRADACVPFNVALSAWQAAMTEAARIASVEVSNPLCGKDNGYGSHQDSCHDIIQREILTRVDPDAGSESCCACPKPATCVGNPGPACCNDHCGHRDPTQPCRPLAAYAAEIEAVEFAAALRRALVLETAVRALLAEEDRVFIQGTKHLFWREFDALRKAVEGV